MPTFLLEGDWQQLPAPSSNTWTDVDLDSYGCPSDTAGVIIMFRNPTDAGAESTKAGVRPNGSTDSSTVFYGFNNFGPKSRERFRACGCDANNIVEIYITSGTNVEAYIAGWILDGDGEFPVNAVAATGSWSASYSTFSLSGFNKQGQTPVAWLLALSNGHWASEDAGLRPQGSSDAGEYRFGDTNSIDTIVGIGTDQNSVQAKFDDPTNKSLYIRGMFTASSGYNPILDIVPLSGDTYTMRTVSSAAADSWAIFYVDPNASGEYHVTRHPTLESSRTLQTSTYTNAPHFGFVQLTASKQFESKRNFAADNDTGYHFTGYFEASSAVAPSYPDIEAYWGHYYGADFSSGWVDHNPTDFGAIDLPDGLSISSAGYVSGHPHPAVGDTTYQLEFSSTRINTDVRPALADEWAIELEFYVSSADARADSDLFGCDLSNRVRLELATNTVSIEWGGSALTNVSAASFNRDAWNTLRVEWKAGTAPVVTTQKGSGSGASMGGTAPSADLSFGNYRPGGGSLEFLGRIKNIKYYTGDPDAVDSVLRRYFPVHDNSSTINDLMGNVNASLSIGSGSWSNQPPTPPVSDYYNFNGVARLEIQNFIVSAANLLGKTVEVEVWFNTTPDTDRVIFGGSEDSWVPLFAASFSTTTVNTVYFNHASLDHASTVADATTGKWHTFKCYFQSGKMRLSWNGTAVDGDNISTRDTTNTQKMILGCGSRVHTSILDGYLRNLKFYDGDMVDGSSGTLLGEFPMDDGSFPLQDISGQGNFASGITAYTSGGTWEEP